LRLCARDQYAAEPTVMNPRQQYLVLHCKDSALSSLGARVAY
jgi:hypothetical protein